MYMLRTFSILILSLLSFCNPAHADHGSHDIQSMVQWIVDNSRFEYHGDPYPTVITEDTLTVCSEIFPDREPHADCNIAGYYDHEQNLIVIADQVTEYMVEDHFREVVLLHELVHFVQYHDGEYERAECKQALEIDAFELQDQWIDEQGIDPEQKNDPLFVVFVTMCEPNLMMGSTH
jgi:hypothetical protein